jgi:hypothetical protein
MVRRRKQLVLEHLEGLSGRVLEEYQDEIKKLIHGRSGVYVLYRARDLYYIGLAKNLVRRLKQHLRDRHDGEWDRFSVYVTVHNDHIKELESLLLRISDPSGNKQSGKFIASKNLHPVLSGVIKDADNDRRAVLLGGKVAERRRRSKTKKGRGSVALAGVVEKRLRLKAIYRGYEYAASLRKDGRISCGGELFDNPTAAAKTIVRTKTVNGWRFWKYKNTSGDWVALAQYR